MTLGSSVEVAHLALIRFHPNTKHSKTPRHVLYERDVFFCQRFLLRLANLMTRRFPSSLLASLIFFILLVQSIAVYQHLYFFYWWLDIPVHILGGLWIALFGLAAYYNSSRLKQKEYSTVFVVSFAVALTLVIGLGWEIYEFGVEHAVGDFGVGLADTLKDLVDDLIGASLAALVFIKGGYNKNMNSFLRPSLGGENEDVSTSLTRLANRKA